MKESFETNIQKMSEEQLKERFIQKRIEELKEKYPDKTEEQIEKVRDNFEKIYNIGRATKDVDKQIDKVYAERYKGLLEQEKEKLEAIESGSREGDSDFSKEVIEELENEIEAREKRIGEEKKE